MPILVVQQGHCNRTSGATGTTGEQDFARRVAAACVRLLHGRNGWSVRPILADSGSYAGDAFVAIHGDGSNNSTAHGASCGYQTPEGQRFGQAWKRAYAARGWPRGFRPDNYTPALANHYGVRGAVGAGNRRSIILEAGFLTNPQDRAEMTSLAGIERVARSLGDALGIGSVPPLKEEDVLPRDLIHIASWTGSPVAWLVSPMGHWQIKDWDDARRLAEVYDLPRQADGDPIIMEQADTAWFGPNLTALTDTVAEMKKTLDRLVEVPPTTGG